MLKTGGIEVHFKLIIAFVHDDKTREVMKAVRDAGATGATVIGNARGQGINPAKSFFGLSLESQRDVLLFLVEGHMSREILEIIGRVAEFEEKPGTGIAIQIDVEDAIGVGHQIEKLSDIVGGKI